MKRTGQNISNTGTYEIGEGRRDRRDYRREERDAQRACDYNREERYSSSRVISSNVGSLKRSRDDTVQRRERGNNKSNYRSHENRGHQEERRKTEDYKYREYYISDDSKKKKRESLANRKYRYDSAESRYRDNTSYSSGRAKGDYAQRSYNVNSRAKNKWLYIDLKRFSNNMTFQEYEERWLRIKGGNKYIFDKIKVSIISNLSNKFSKCDKRDIDKLSFWKDLARYLKGNTNGLEEANHSPDSKCL